MIFLNNEFIEKNQAHISVMDRGFLFGDGVYEIIPVYNNKIFHLNAHLLRLQASLDSVKIKNPYNLKEWYNILSKLLGFYDNKEQSIYLQISRGVSDKRKYSFNDLTPTVYIESNPLLTKTKQALKAGFSAITQPDIRWHRCDIKSTSLLANVMYLQQAKEKNVEEIILYRDNQVTEGATSNVFIIKNNTLFTHPTSAHILSGITRDLVLKSARACHIPIKETSFSMNELNIADELWISSSTREIMPITKVDGKLINRGNIGNIWNCIYDYYQSLKNV
ncbi:branched chain amino acid: 2-keto-4-methylthiobutyrate aminotransferase [Candidatus Ruthia magnifica str. Cm (Calyptogena magnifica)]|uniref:Aminodeoxychorismate lyase n=1 Tax=Ruthia magnifica subsp. Calyptogena magnifica TaxID=413404 RepID=A1AWB8_RUTMC|nr:aminotransferase class IV [Candidatus Ruthturnera calyptogenae]ABL02225.1 branched chain amino acid: 2-keto-4-methylthiobutyrate aminotransferase [Candidatus Ruthia magnifica str. Cm (Calyptogena magnifica)]